jgi:pyruvate/2-oxoglutarate/acetoin dehydrogenase E1 component
MIHRSLRAAEILAKESIEAEVIDPRTLKPLDEELIIDSVKKTGRLITVHEAPLTGGFGAEVAALVSEKAFESLKSPIKRIAAPDSIIPFAPNLEDLYYPTIETIVSAAKDILR